MLLHTPDAQERLEPPVLPPPMVAWLHPLELLRTAYHAWLSRVATSYLDRREMLAALDRDPESGEPAFFAPAAPVSPGLPGVQIPDALRYDPFFASAHPGVDGAWVDFVADLGDSWEATHAVATLLARSELVIGGHELPHADLVVLGGDLVYPSPTRDSYRRRTRDPLSAAFPRDQDKPLRPRRLVAIPGNHDWYDGLTSFVREFCQGGWLGGWQLGQMRSYFALKPIQGWWVWGIDIALDTRVDPAQQTYFLDVLENRNLVRHPKFEEGDKVILCTAKPSWLPSSRYSDDAYKNLQFFARELIQGHKGTVAVILSGDLHHYARYATPDGVQLITSGSGGSYLMGTHHLPAEVRPFERNERLADGSGPQSAFVRTSFPYPSEPDSRRLSLRALWLAFRRHNIPFCVTVGVISYWLVMMIGRMSPDLLAGGEASFSEKFWKALDWQVDFPALASVLFIIVGCEWLAATANRRARRWLTLPWGALHGLAHLALTVVLAVWLMPHPLQTISRRLWPYVAEQTPFHPAEIAIGVMADFMVFVLIAGWAGATLVGVYLTVSDRVLRWHQNEVFAAQSLFDYRSFVRLHLLANGHLEIFPIGLRRVPRRWRSRLVRERSDPLYEPTDGELKPHLIEGPITVTVAGKFPRSAPQHGTGTLGT
jgi:hypothetical protein